MRSRGFQSRKWVSCIIPIKCMGHWTTSNSKITSIVSVAIKTVIFSLFVIILRSIGIKKSDVFREIPRVALLHVNFYHNHYYLDDKESCIHLNVWSDPKHVRELHSRCSMTSQMQMSIGELTLRANCISKKHTWIIATQISRVLLYLQRYRNNQKSLLKVEYSERRIGARI